MFNLPKKTKDAIAIQALLSVILEDVSKVLGEYNSLPHKPFSPSPFPDFCKKSNVHNLMGTRVKNNNADMTNQ